MTQQHWFSIYSAEEIEEGNWAIINEDAPTGYLVKDGLEKEAARFYVDIMNDVYNQTIKDIRG